MTWSVDAANELVGWSFALAERMKSLSVGKKEIEMPGNGKRLGVGREVNGTCEILGLEF